MPRFLLALALILTSFAPVSAEEIGGSRSGQELISFLRSTFRPQQTLSYKAAREKMFEEIDNRGGRVRCVYTGVEIATQVIPNATVMNTEHTWPQSKFQEKLPMKSDLFHLFPTLSKVNSERGSNPFGEIPDTQTEGWWRANDPQSNTPGTDIKEFSESVDDRFEPREDHKGNVARAMLYFWVVYGAENVTPKFINSQLNTLLSWHEDDKADDTERQRDASIAQIQGNHNPFILDPTLARRVVSTGRPALVGPLARAFVPQPAALAPQPAAADGQPISVRIAAWNMQSTMDPDEPESDPEFLARLMGQKKGINLWGLSEVADAEALAAFEQGAEEGENTDFVAILGKTGGSDRLAVLYDRNIFQPIGEPFELKRETRLSGGLRASLVVKFRGQRTGQEFLFVVNHLKRGGAQNEVRLEQAQNLNAWARTQQLPIIAVGDFNFDYDPQHGHLGLPHRDGGFDALTEDGVFEWIKPQRLLRTQADDSFKSILDFIFVAHAPFEWTGESRILDQQGDQPATEDNFDDDAETTDHRPVDAILMLKRSAPARDAAAPAARARPAPRAPLSARMPRALAGNQLLIGAWNIEHLGLDGDDTNPEDVAEYILGSQVAVLGLEEIYDTDGMDSTRTSAKLNAAFQHLETQTGERWQYRLFPKSTHEAASEQEKQLTGVAWNTSRVQLSGEPLLIPVDHGGARPNDFWRRQPHAVKFTTSAGKSDFVVIPVHMRSNSRASGQTTQPPELRAREAESLLAQLDAVRRHFADQDIVILGDTNVLSADESAVQTFVRAGLRDLNPGDMKTWMRNGVGRSPFDRFFVPDGQPEFRGSTQDAVLTFPPPMTSRVFNRRVSDHLMIRTSITLGDDDD